MNKINHIAIARRPLIPNIKFSKISKKLESTLLKVNIFNKDTSFTPNIFLIAALKITFE